MSRAIMAASFAALLGACVPEGAEQGAPKGPPIEIVEAARAGDTTRVVMRYRRGDAIAQDDEPRAMARAVSIACKEGENAIADTTSRNGGLLTARVFCLTVLETQDVVTPRGFRI